MQQAYKSSTKQTKQRYLGQFKQNNKNLTKMTIPCSCSSIAFTLWFLELHCQITVKCSTKICQASSSTLRKQFKIYHFMTLDNNKYTKLNSPTYIKQVNLLIWTSSAWPRNVTKFILFGIASFFQWMKITDIKRETSYLFWQLHRLYKIITK